MFPQKKLALFVGLVVSNGYASYAMAEQVSATELGTVYVTENQDDTATEGSGSYTVKSSDSATKLKLSPKQTPQMVNTTTRTKMDDFSQNSIKDVLAGTSGVNVEQVETDRTYYTARGFDITNFQVDGVGLPLTFGLADGDIDTAIYDHIDVIKGSNALLNGTGEPSATVNMVRKRPTSEFQSSATGSVGSWNNKRIEGDISGPMSENGKLRGRMVAVNQNKDSYLDLYGTDQKVFYGIMEADLTDTTMLTFGLHYQKHEADSPLWGALPLTYSDGSATNYDASKTTSTDWAYWDTTEERSFVELSQKLANNWKVKTSLTHIASTQDSKLFYMYGTPDKTTGTGLYAYPSAYVYDGQQNLIDVNASGPFRLGGREHQLAVGANISHANIVERSDYSSAIGQSVGDFSQWDGSFAEPDFSASSNTADYNDKQLTAYSGARFSLTDDLAWIVGGRITSWETEGQSYGEDKAAAEHGKVTPYTGVVYDINANYAVYASYAGIFAPQNKSDSNGDRLKPVTGDSYETGVKGEFFDKKLNTTVALFKTKQDNMAEQAGTSGGKAYYTAVSGIRSQGYEFDIAGQIWDDLEASGGFTHVDIDNSDGSAAKTYTPRDTFKLAGTYRMNKWKAGAGLSWQSDIYTTASGFKVTQDSYALLNLMAGYDFTRNLSATLNVYNVANEKYINSLYWSQGYYGAPRNAMLSVSWKL
nr:TonB-dependent siderophore receptor [uncultured Tolumonas sp.]